MLDCRLPPLGSIIFREIVPKSNTRSRLAVEFRKLDLIGRALQSFRKWGDGGVREGVASTTVWGPTAAGTLGGRRRAERGCSRSSELVHILLWVIVHRRPEVGQLLWLIGGTRWRRGAVGLEP